MPIYATKAELLEAVGQDRTTVVSDSDATGSEDNAEITRWLAGAAAEIEAHAAPYGLVPTDVTAEALATPGTYPRWWKYANLEIAVYRMALDAGAYTKEQRKRYEDWLKKLETLYPSTLEDGQAPVSGQSVKIVGRTREFSAAEQVGL